MRRLIVALALAGMAWLAVSAAPSSERVIDVQARMFRYTPDRIEVERGDTVVIRLTALDVIHGFYLDGYGVDAVARPGHPTTIRFVADRGGKFRFRCSFTCGSLHPFMIGELVVRPNSPLRLMRHGILLVLVICGALGWASSPRGAGGRAATRRAANGWRLDLLRWRAVRWVFTSRVVQAVLWSAAVFGLTLTLMAAFFGSPLGSHNAATELVWVGWWAALVLVLIPLTGRLWCAACPIPLAGDFLQRLAPGMGQRKWPRALRGDALQNVLFLALATGSAFVFTHPAVTGLLVLGMVGLSLGLAMAFEGRAFCRHVCPAGGFIGLYSAVAPLELRARDAAACRSCERPCVHGSEEAYACPWLAYPVKGRSADCGLCGECVRACPHDNVGLRVRPPGAELDLGLRRSGEAWRSLLLLGAGAAYSVVFLGPGGWVKDALRGNDALLLLQWVALFLAVVAGAVPASFWLAARLSGWLAGRTSPRGFRTLAASTVPLGLALWMAFTLTTFLTAGGSLVTVLRDPMGWGWSLPAPGELVTWRTSPMGTSWMPLAQTALLLCGLYGGARVAWRMADELYGAAALRGWLPIAAWLGAATWALAAIFLG